MPRVVHFEIHAKDPDRTIEFYRKCLGWSFRKTQGPTPYWHVLTGTEDEPGIHGGMIESGEVQEAGPPHSFVCTIEVNAIDDTLQRIQSCGGQVVIPKLHVPRIGWLAYCKDLEGNLFRILQKELPNR